MKPIILTLLLTTSLFAAAEPIPVRHLEGRAHGFVVLRDEANKLIGSGEVIQFAHGDRVTYRMTYRFKDGSLDDETATFTQHTNFQFVSDHHIQRGPLFSKPFDTTVDATGQVTTRTPGGNGPPKVETAHIDVQPDFVQGFICTVMDNLDPKSPAYRVSMLAPTPKVRLIHLGITPEGTKSYSVAGLHLKASVFRIKTELGGVAGVVAPLIGKQPDDIFVWVAEGEAPAVVRADLQLSEGGPYISIELAGLTFSGR